jgi:electron-transferring-flavoprotein dehydrogenase
LWREGLPFTQGNLKARYEERRRASWLESESRIAEHARRGFQSSVLAGFAGMALAGLSGGRYHWPGQKQHKPQKSLEEFFLGRLSRLEIEEVRRRCEEKGEPLHDALMDAAGWPRIEYDGELLVSHQDALLMGGKVQAPAEFPDHVVFRDEGVCEQCAVKPCVEICSGEAIHRGEGPAPAFDREKCVHCGVCLWNCPSGNISFCAAPGGLHSAEN